MDLLKKIDVFVNDEISTGDVAVNNTKGNIDVVGGDCPDGQVYDKIKKVCVPSSNEAKIIKKYTNKEYGIESHVVKIDRGFSVTLKDLDSGEFLETSYIYPNEKEKDAHKRAKKIVEAGTVSAMVAGSGQTRAVGRKNNIMIDLKRKNPVEVDFADPTLANLSRISLRFNTLLGAYVPEGE